MPSLKAMQKECKVLENKCDGLQTELDALESRGEELRGLEEKVAQIRAERKKLAASTFFVPSERADQRRVELEAQESTLTERFGEVDAQRRAIESQQADLEREIAALEPEIQRLTIVELFTQAKGTMEARKEVEDRIRKSIRSLIEEFETAWKKQETSLRALSDEIRGFVDQRGTEFGIEARELGKGEVAWSSLRRHEPFTTLFGDFTIPPVLSRRTPFRTAIQELAKVIHKAE